MRFLLGVLLVLAGCWDFDKLVCDIHIRSTDCQRTCQPVTVAEVQGCFQDLAGTKYYTLSRDSVEPIIGAEPSNECGMSTIYHHFTKAFPTGMGVLCDTTQAINFTPTLNYFLKGEEVFLDVPSGL